MQIPSKRKLVAFLPAHPKQVWILRSIADELSPVADVLWVLRDKDCSVPLAKALGLDYILMSKAASGRWGNALELAGNIIRCVRISREHEVDMWVTKYGCGSIAARLTGAKSLAYGDDDVDIVPVTAWTSFPFAEMALVTRHTRMGRFEHKAVRFQGCFELCYLHPSRFTPDRAIWTEMGLADGEPYAIVRLSSLRAHHDHGIRGASTELLRRLVQLSGNRFRLLITSEDPLVPEFEPLRLTIPPQRIMHALAFAEFFVGDGQTMTTEAAVLGTPAFRINDFVGRIASMEEIASYGLTFGFRPGQESVLLNALNECLGMSNRKAIFAERRQRYLSDSIDPVPWFAQVIRMTLDGATIGEVRHWAQRHHGID